MRTISAQTVPGSSWSTASPSQLGFDAAELQAAVDYAQGIAAGHILISRQGKRASLQRAGSITQNVDIKSATKSWTGVLLCLAIQDGLVSMNQQATALLSGFGLPPSGNQTLRQDVIIEDLANHTAGFTKPGGFTAITHTPVGEKWFYSDGAVNWLADILTTVWRKDLSAVFRDRIGSNINSTISWRQNAYRPTQLNGVTRREGAAGITASVDDMARFGLLLRRDGMWGTKRVLPSDCDDRFRQTPRAGTIVVDPTFPNSDGHYSNLFWNNRENWVDGIPTDAYWAKGLNESIVFIVPSLDLVVARLGAPWPAADRGLPGIVVEGFLQRVVAAINVVA